VHIQTDAHSDVLITILHFAPGVKVKAAHTQLPSVGPEVIPVLGSQPAGNVSHKPGGRLPLLSARPAVTFPARRPVQISLLGEQRHNGCEQFV